MWCFQVIWQFRLFSREKKPSQGLDTHWVDFSDLAGVIELTGQLLPATLHSLFQGRLKFLIYSMRNSKNSNGTYRYEM